MRRAAICLGIAIFLGVPAISNAQDIELDRQTPKEYTDDDSQMLALTSDLLYPAGFAIEWLIARPMHYATTQSPLSPVFRPADSGEWELPPPIPIIPDRSFAAQTEGETHPQEEVIVPSGPPAPETAPKPAKQPAAPAYPAQPSGQPALH